jgi:hypothetical protein
MAREATASRAIGVATLVPALRAGDAPSASNRGAGGALDC